MEIAGEGALLALLEKTRQRLAAEGLFAPERKRPLPFIPRVIGVVTSPTGAVIRDILHRLADRFPSHVLVWPVLVQGQGAAEQVAAAVRGFGATDPEAPMPRPDLLIVARGGGSIEDLWSFNEEIVVRAIAESPIPVISAVGHETDTTLADYAADRRAPTPTAAAEIAVPVLRELAATLDELGLRQRKCALRPVALGRERLEARAGRLPQPEALAAAKAQRARRPGRTPAPRSQRPGGEGAAPTARRPSPAVAARCCARTCAMPAPALGRVRLAPALVTRPLAEQRRSGSRRSTGCGARSTRRPRSSAAMRWSAPRAIRWYPRAPWRRAQSFSRSNSATASLDVTPVWANRSASLGPSRQSNVPHKTICSSDTPLLRPHPC